jgi:ATP-binding cassette subfamily B protein
VPRPVGPWSYLARFRGQLWFGVAMLLATNALALAVPYYLGRTIDALRGPDPGGTVPTLALLMCAFAIGQAIVRIGSRMAVFNAARAAEADLRSHLFAHVITLDPAYFRAHPVGEVMSRLTSDVQTVRAMWGPGLLNLVNTSVVFSVALIVMLRVDPWLTLWALLPYPSMVLIGAWFGKGIYRTSQAVQEELGKLSSALQEDLTGIAIIKTYTAERDREELFAERSRRLVDKNMELTRVRGQLMPILSAIASLGTVIVLFVGGHRVIDGRLGLGELVQFNAYLAMLVWPTLALGWMLSLLKRGQASWTRLANVLATEPTIQSGSARLPADAVRGHVELRGLTVAVEGRTLLDGVSLDLQPGSVTAVVGRIGGGKSTLVDAIPRLVDVAPGQVFLDGHDVTALDLGDLRRSIGYAPQESYLFSATIAENIAMGADQGVAGPLDAGELRRRVEEAARAAGLDRDLAALPDGLETVVGERGVMLSGGQRQRVALARALVGRPRVLILDDSLSSVDAETEQAILAALDQVMAGRTSIVISHRVAAVRRAHQIAVLEGGKLIELGGHDALIARGGVYAELYRSQVEKEILA